MDFSLLPEQRSTARREAGESSRSDDMAEILRAWDDTDDEMVEFIQGSGEFGTSQHDSDGLRFDEIDTSSERRGNGAISATRPHRVAAFPIYNMSSAVVRYLYTSCVFVAFFGLGISVAMPGPTLLDLAFNTSTSLQNMSYIFMARSIGYLIGSLAGGWLFDKCNRNLVLSVSCLWSALMMIIVPIGNSIYLLAFVVFLMGISFGSLDTGGNALIVKVWEAKSRPYMQALHFAFALGAFVSPLVAKPFLSAPSYAPNVTSNHLANTTTTLPSVTWAYWLGLLPLLVAGLGFLFCVCMKNCRMQEPISQISTPTRNNQLGRIIIIILSLFFAFLMLYVGLEVAYGGYLFAFGIKSTLHMSNGDAAYLVSGFWGSFALSRLAAVPLSHYIRPAKLLLMDTVGCFLASALLASQFNEGCLFADQTKLWVGTILLGISMASVFPTSMSWAEYYFDVSGRTASILVGGASFGEMLIPLLVGNLFATVGPCVLMSSTLVISILVFIIFIAIFTFGKYMRKRSTSIEMHYQKKQQEPLKESHKDEVLRLLKPNNGSLLNDTDI